VSAGIVTSSGGLPNRRPLPVIYGDLRRWGLIHADALEFLAALPAASVSAVIADPPYGLSMESWDGGRLANGEGFQAFTQWWATEIFRVLRPGAFASVVGSSRTAHRLVTGLENAGLEIRDQLLWMYGSGVPKSRRMDGLGSGLRPTYEPIVLARKPLDPSAKTILGNVAAHGTGALNIDATRIAKPDAERPRDGYWPTNLVLGHDDECRPASGGCMPDCPVPLIDRIATQQRSAGAPPFSRLFYAARASRREREAGLEHLPAQLTPIFSGTLAKPRANIHKTVKPLSLMRFLVRLIVPPGGDALVLDPFAGSGSTLIAAVLEGRAAIGIERDARYVAIANARIAHWAAQPGGEAP
jgi:site-specific DNA-methyltransferase (adenine-specific)